MQDAISLVRELGSFGLLVLLGAAGLRLLTRAVAWSVQHVVRPVRDAHVALIDQLRISEASQVAALDRLGVSVERLVQGQQEILDVSREQAGLVQTLVKAQRRDEERIRRLLEMVGSEVEEEEVVP